MNHEKIKDEPKALIARPKLENKDLIIFTYVRRYLDKIPGSQGLVETLRNSF